jgi:hypothetical protein
MVIYTAKELMALCSDYALDAPVQKILFSLDLWVPKAARVWLIFFHISSLSIHQILLGSTY